MFNLNRETSQWEGKTPYYFAAAEADYECQQSFTLVLQNPQRYQGFKQEYIKHRVMLQTIV